MLIKVPLQSEVDTFLAKLNHPLTTEIKTLRTLILASEPGITEHIKWNAPSFSFKGDDKITFKLHPANTISLIFHRGAKVKDSQNFHFTDSSNLMKWLSKDRGIVTFSDAQDIESKKKDFSLLVTSWLKATQ